ncbi:MAG: hypothetical protein M3362_23090, partial [Acidobacteriota bacterium]|nr:hypothetical protein [Acidobacteriota bacterium]
AHMREVDICAVKSLTGHASAASGIIEVIASVLTLCEGIVPPVVTCTEPDPECNVKTNLRPVERPVKTVLKNAFGFGGQYTSVVLHRASNSRRLVPRVGDITGALGMSQHSGKVTIANLNQG